MTRLNVNIDHIATVRQARRTWEPSLAAAAVIADLAGADGVTVHLRADRRHVQDEDVRILRQIVKTHLNLEMSSSEDIVALACQVKPDTATLVPERRDEITTEGGLDVLSRERELGQVAARLKSAGIMVSVFLDPLPAQIDAAARIGAGQIEICTARYAELTDPTTEETRSEIESEISRIVDCAVRAGGSGLQVAAGHGLTYRNVRRIADINPMEELNIGHNIVARAVLVGLERAVKEMIAAIKSDVI